MDTITNVSKIVFLDTTTEGTYLDGIHILRGEIWSTAANTEVDLGVYADSNNIEIELEGTTGNYYRPVYYVLTKDGSFYIKLNESNKIEVKLGDVILTSGASMNTLNVNNSYIRVNIANNTLSLYMLYYYSDNNNGHMTYDYKTTYYSTSPLSSQKFCVFGIPDNYTSGSNNEAGLHYLRIKKDNSLVFYGVPARNTAFNTKGIYDKMTGEFYTPKTGSVDVTNGATGLIHSGVFHLSLAETVNCNEHAFVNNSGNSAFSISKNLTDVILPSSVANLSYAFSDCTGLKNVYVPSPNVNTIHFAFYNTGNTTKNVHVPANSSTYDLFIASGYDNAGTKDGVVLFDDL